MRWVSTLSTRRLVDLITLTRRMSTNERVIHENDCRRAIGIMCLRDTVIQGYYNGQNVRVLVITVSSALHLSVFTQRRRACFIVYERPLLDRRLHGIAIDVVHVNRTITSARLPVMMTFGKRLITVLIALTLNVLSEGLLLNGLTVLITVIVSSGLLTVTTVIVRQRVNICLLLLSARNVICRNLRIKLTLRVNRYRNSYVNTTLVGLNVLRAIETCRRHIRVLVRLSINVLPLCVLVNVNAPPDNSAYNNVIIQNQLCKMTLDLTLNIVNGNNLHVKRSDDRVHGMQLSSSKNSVTVNVTLRIARITTIYRRPILLRLIPNVLNVLRIRILNGKIVTVSGLLQKLMLIPVVKTVLRSSTCLPTLNVIRRNTTLTTPILVLCLLVGITNNVMQFLRNGRLSPSVHTMLVVLLET